MHECDNFVNSLLKKMHHTNNGDFHHYPEGNAWNSGIAPVADLGKVHPCHHPQTRGQTLHQETKERSRH